MDNTDVCRILLETGLHKLLMVKGEGSISPLFFPQKIWGNNRRNDLLHRALWVLCPLVVATHMYMARFDSQLDI